MNPSERSGKPASTDAFRASDLTFTALSVALIAVCSWISVPMTVPFTLQTFAVCLSAALLGWRQGLAATAAYLLLGAIGLPVFAGFRGGFGVLLGATGGYLIGFLFTAILVGFAVERFGRRLPVLIAAMASGILICYAFGTVWFMVVYMRQTGPIGLSAALGWCVIPYIPADAAKVLLASVLTNRLYPVVSRLKDGGDR